MKSNNLKTLLLAFLLTGLINNSEANNYVIYSDTIQINDTIKEKSFFETEIQKNADDSIKIDALNGKGYLYGNAKIKYQKTTITADYIEIDWTKNIIIAKTRIDSTGKDVGYPVFTEGNESFKAHKITYNFKTKKCRVNEIVTKEGEGYILGKIVKKMEDDVFYIKKGNYTTCDAEEPHFSIRASKIKVVPGEKIITGPAYLTFFNIPTPFIFPFGYFPNNEKESSGFIIPSYGESTNLGLFLKDGGYYFSLNEKMDLTLKSDIYSQGSWSLNSNLRYKKRYKYNGDLKLSYANILNSEKGFPDYSIQKDFNLKWKHQQDIKANPSLQFSANLEIGSSTYHRNNSYNADDFLKNSMSSSINLTKNWERSLITNLTFNLRHSQNTSTEIVNLTIPDISLNSRRIYPFKKLVKVGKTNWYEKIMIKYTLNTKNTISTPDSLLFTKKSLSNFRNGMQHTIPISTSIKVLKHFTLNPKLNITERWYLSQIRKEWDANSNSIITDTIKKFTRGHNYTFSAGINTKIYGGMQFKNKRIAAIRHVITPSLSFNYQPDFSDEKYGYYKEVQSNEIGDTEKYSIMSNGIYGSPSQGRRGTISFGINNILEMKIKNKKDTTQPFTKIKLLESLNIRSSYNLFADSLNMSNISLNARTRILDIFDITFSSIYDPYIPNKDQTKNINQFEFATNKRLARLTSFNTTIGLTLNDQSFVKNKQKENEKEERDFYSIPWNLNANYSLTYNKGYKSSAFSDTIQSLNFSGDLKIAKKWKVGFRSGYDFDEKELTYTSIDFYRDLHCWEMLFNWIPIGYHQSYTLTVRVKAEALRDLKYEKRKDWLTPDYD